MSFKKLHSWLIQDKSLRGIQSSLLVGAFFLAFMSSAYADQNSTQYGIPFDVNNAGGADVSKSNIYLLSDSLGEPIVGHGDSDKYKLDSGYRQPSASDFISLSCTNIVDLGSVVGTGQKTGSGTCTVYTDAYDGYRLVWKAGSNNSSSLVGHWKLDETSGTNAYDLSGNGYDGTLTNGPVISTDTPSKFFSTRSVNFDGVNDYVSLPAGVISSGPMTQSYWVKLNSLPSVKGTIFSRVNGYVSAFVDSTGHFATLLDGSNYRTSNATLSTGVWYHLAVTNDGTTTRQYVNGVPDKIFTEAIVYSTGQYEIGRRSDVGYYFPGAIDDVRVYNTALSADVIRDLASKAPPGSLTASGSQTRYIPGIFFPSTGGLVGHWKMEEIVGGSTVTDSSGYNRDGTPNGAAGSNNLPQPSTEVPGNTTFLTTKSLNFDGTDDYVQSSLNKTFIGNTPTIAFWIRPTGAQTTKGIMQVANGLNDSGPWVLLQRTSPTTVRWYLNANYRITQTVNDNAYYHIALTFDGTTWQAYKNGVADGTYIGAVGINSAASTFLGNGYDGYFSGLLDDVRIYNRALSAAEITALYSQPQAWSVAATESAWGARLSSDSTDNDSKWGADGGSEKWLNLGDGTYTVVRRGSATPLAGSVEQMEFRGEVGSSKIQTSGVYRGVATFTVVGY